MNNQTFDLRRFSLLLKKELWTGNKKPLIVAGAVFGFLILFAWSMTASNNGYEFLNFNLFPIVLFGGGFIFTSVAFYEFNDKTGTHHYLSLPASHFEKFLSKWLITAILFPIAIVLLYWGYVKCADGLYHYYTEKSMTTWFINNWWTFFFLKIYLVVQSIFLVGAIAFQKYTFFKTSVTTFLSILFFGILCMISFRLLFAAFFDGFEPVGYMDTNHATRDFVQGTMLKWAEYALWFLVPPIMWAAGYFKLKEKEA